MRGRPRWQYLVGVAIVGAIATVSGVAVAVTSLDSLSDDSGSGNYTFMCDSVITGYHQGGVAVTRGTVCIESATVTGGVAVSTGASVIILDSTIVGGVSEANPHGTQICGSTVKAGVSIVGSTGFVLVGDPGNGCAANDLGSLSVLNNHHGLVVLCNTVHGALVASNNSGAGPLPGQTGPIVAGNHP
jgi:hypothetical protein